MKEFGDQLSLTDEEESLKEALEAREADVVGVRHEIAEPSLAATALQEALEEREQDMTDDRALDDQADKLGSYDQARRYLDMETTEFPKGQKRAKRKQRHYSRRGGRSYPEKSGRDIAREIANQEPPATDEERQKSRASAAHAEFLAEKDRLKYEAAVEKANGDPRQLAILQRNISEGKW